MTGFEWFTPRLPVPETAAEEDEFADTLTVEPRED